MIMEEKMPKLAPKKDPYDTLEHRSHIKAKNRPEYRVYHGELLDTLHNDTSNISQETKEKYKEYFVDSGIEDKIQLDQSRSDFFDTFKPRKIPNLPIPPKSSNYSLAQPVTFVFPNYMTSFVCDAVAYPDGSIHYLTFSGLINCLADSTATS